MKDKTTNKTIAKNTLVLYFRMLLTVIVSLYTSREVLHVLGVDDYGIYNVVGGIVMLFTFINSGMIASSQRFIAFELGKGDLKRQVNAFSTSFYIHGLISILIFILAIPIGLIFIHYYMNIPPDRIFAADIVCISTVLSLCVNILAVPYTATIIAHEKMNIYAWVSIADSLLRLLIVLLLYLLSGDKLIIYSILIVSIGIVDFLCYYRYAKVNFTECILQKPEDKGQIKEMLSFAGWSFFGNFSLSAKDYGVNILVNLFGSVAINAARGLSYQAMSAINGFVSNFQMAFNPQIIKQYASGDRESMTRLVASSSKLSFVLLSLIVVPFSLRADYVMQLWLHEVPEYTLIFLQLASLMGLVNCMAGPIVVGIQATGKIRNFQILISSIMLMDIPISYFLLKCGCPIYSVMYVAIATSIVGLVTRIILYSNYLEVGKLRLFRNLLLINPIAFLIIYGSCQFLFAYIPDSFLGLCCCVIISTFINAGVSYLMILESAERVFVQNVILKLIKK